MSLEVDAYYAMLVALSTTITLSKEIFIEITFDIYQKMCIKS